MGMVGPERRIASAFLVMHGPYGAVSRYARERGVCRQWIYREATSLRNELANAQQEIHRLREQLRQAQQQRAQLEARLAQSVCLDAQKQEELACVGQARGVTLRDCRELLEVLIPGQTLSVAELGRRTHAAGQRAGALLGVLDEVARTKVREAAADEIYVKDPVLMIVEPAEAMTLPLTVIRIVPPGFSVRARHRACGAATVQPPPLPTVPFVTTKVAWMLDACRPCVPSPSGTAFET